MGGNPNDEVMKGARELRQLRVKSGADDKLKEELRVCVNYRSFKSFPNRALNMREFPSLC